MNYQAWLACSLLAAVPDKSVHCTVGITSVFPHFLPFPVSYTLGKEQLLPVPTLQFL